MKNHLFNTCMRIVMYVQYIVQVHCGIAILSSLSFLDTSKSVVGGGKNNWYQACLLCTFPSSTLLLCLFIYLFS